MTFIPKVGMKVEPIGVKNKKSLQGIIVEVTPPTDQGHGTVATWLTNKTGYGQDNCEHYAYVSDEQIARVLREVKEGDSLHKKQKSMACGKCGGSNVLRDAVAKWDVTAQDWVLVGVHDCACCGDCEAEGDNILVEQERTMPDVRDKVIQCVKCGHQGQPGKSFIEVILEPKKPRDPLSVVCPVCSAAVGTPCTHKRRTKLAREQAAGGK